jgi:transposase-like protein
MPIYQYCCENCSISATKVEKKKLVADIDNNVSGFNNDEYLFFIECSMNNKKSKPRCPKCKKNKTRQSFSEMTLTCYVRGDGLVKDKVGARRDMNKFHLVNQDPYGHMRVPGETEHMLDMYRDRGRDMSKIKSERAASSRDAKEQADKIKSTALVKELEDVIIKIEKLGGRCPYTSLSEFDDINGLLSKLMPKYVCKLKNGDFALMAEARKYVDEILNPE